MLPVAPEELHDPVVFRRIAGRPRRWGRHTFFRFDGRGACRLEAGIHEIQRQDAVLAKPDPVFHKVFQFAHVAGPRVGLESVHKFGGDPVGAAPFAAERLEEMGHQQPDVALPLPERGHEQGDHVQPEEQVFTERPLRHQFTEVPVAGGDDADVHAVVDLPADAPDNALLQDTQQLDLKRHGHFGYLVEEEGTRVRLFQKPLLAPAVRAGKRAGLIAEQLAFHERFRDGPAVDGDERPRMAGAVVMDRLRDQLFARPRLPLDKDGGVRAGGLQDSRLEPQDGLALADDAGKTVIARLFGERFHVASAGPKPMIWLMSSNAFSDFISSSAR